MAIGITERHEAFGAIEIAGRARPCDGAEICGDAFLWKAAEGHLTIVVADGLGHGQAARDAADRALAMFAEMPALSPDRIIQRCQTALVRTRGAALAVAQIDITTQMMTFCGVGNVAIREVPRRGGRGASIPGVVGMKLPSLRVFQSRLNPGDLICLHTDGVDGSFDLAGVANLELLEGVHTVQKRWGLAHDDATVVALRIHGTSMISAERPS